MMLICLSVFAGEQSSTTAASLSDNSFEIKAYYKGAVTNAVTLVVAYDNNGNRLYENYAEATDSVNVNREGTIFTWSMTGTSTSSITLTFTFSEFQAKVSSTYYRPSYTIKTYINQTKNQGGTILYDTMYSNNTSAKTPKTGTKGSSQTAYTSTGSASYTGAVTRSGNSYTMNSTSYTQATWSSWEKSGYCTLNITNYENSIVGSYEYTCDVTVGFTVQ